MWWHQGSHKAIKSATGWQKKEEFVIKEIEYSLESIMATPKEKCRSIVSIVSDKAWIQIKAYCNFCSNEC
jgi:hypothetical protein